MSRPISASFSDAVTGSVLTVVYAAEFYFDAPTGTVRYWTGIGDLIINGNTFVGTGNLGSITTNSEDKNLGVNNVTFTLSGIPSDQLSLALEIPCRNRPCKLFAVVFDKSGNIKVTQVIFAGRMDTMTIAEGGDTSIISITAEAHTIDFSRPRLHRWTYSQRKDPTDNGLLNISQASEIVIPWGSQVLYLNRNTFNSNGGGSMGPGAGTAGGTGNPVYNPLPWWSTSNYGNGWTPVVPNGEYQG